ncbi:transcriptional regulator PpsR [Mesorhizobium sp. VNQ89]|uniref:transcriptional regulator PpsR n=1 Tax=Mesorhizobium quangtriensis TaxID=3157709 RepID=UPI0032B71662
MTLDFKHLASADPKMVAELVSAASDLTLVLDREGVINDLAHNLEEPIGLETAAWRGAQVEDVVRVSSRPTLKNALAGARMGKRGGRFDVHHLLQGGHHLPVHYAAFGLGADGGVLMMGRDLRPVSQLQSRLLEMRQSQERDLQGRKQAEAHYRILFDTSADAIAIVDAGTGVIKEVNPRAADFLGLPMASASGRKFVSVFDKANRADVMSMLSGAVASGLPVTCRLEGSSPVSLSADLYRAGDRKLIMVRISQSAISADDDASETGMVALVRNASEAIVLTDSEGQVLWANESFLALADIPLAAHAVGRRLDDFLQWSLVEQDMHLQNVRRYGKASPFASKVKGARGLMTDVAVSAVNMADGASPGYGFVMHVRPQENAHHGGGNSDLTRAAESLVEMVGRVPMKNLVRDTTDVIERMCIESALKLTGQNRASAARVLGLSRQALYLKMNKFGIADDEPL